MRQSLASSILGKTPSAKAALFGLVISVASVGAQTWEFHLNMDGAYLGVVSPGTGGDFNQYPSLGDFPPITYDQPSHTFTHFDVGFGNANPPFADVQGTVTDPPLPFAIHGPSSSGTVGQTLYTFEYNPQDAHSGSTFVGQTLTLQDISGYTVTDQEADLLAGRWSFVVPTDYASSPGEIGGALTPVPEPEEFALIAGFGLLAFASVRKFRRSAASLGRKAAHC
jgi:hypothetical protein